jgi:hypothetical protein
MKRVFALPESAELELLKNQLETAGSRCALRNEQLSQVVRATPSMLSPRPNVEPSVRQTPNRITVEGKMKTLAGLWIDHREAVNVIADKARAGSTKSFSLVRQEYFAQQ